MADEVSELRHFLYLDDDLVNEFLAQLEEGELSEFQVQSSSESSGGAGGRLGLPIRVWLSNRMGKVRHDLQKRQQLANWKLSGRPTTHDSLSPGHRSVPGEGPHRRNERAGPSRNRNRGCDLSVNRCGFPS